ncbi:nitroreductase [Desulfatibacillum aliphaticivorans]|uniref:Nitroreductase n=1 Tax=Desulfatibacillum aliphaticivorans TaxID=218208 RepID=B8FFH5_DESAL|nr:nitroreductase family protein [Desulfatibacillum aliphaticivorans]ACL04235.1 nitroreductase [Desulfatibacillum aliphaticivorans]
MLEKHKHISFPPKTDFPIFQVDDEKCIGCGRCVNSCPIQLLMLDSDKKARPNERYDHFRCICCQNCAASCPNDAITIQGDYRVHEGFWKNDNLFEGGKTFPDPLYSRNGAKYEDYEDQLTETEKVIYNRRSIRLYKKKRVPKELVHRIIEAGRFAPSAGNNQPWKFVAITNPDVIEEIDQICKKRVRLFPQMLMPHPWVDKQVPGDKNAKPKKWQKTLHYLLSRKTPGDVDQRVLGGINTISSDPEYRTFFKAPALIILAKDVRGIGSPDLDLGICGQNMVLAAHSLGLGTCWVSLIKGLTWDHRYVRKVLGLEYPFKILTSLTLGYPAGQVDNIVARERQRVNWIE